MDIIGNRRVFLSIAGVIVLAALVAIGTFGLKTGIDFRGGTLWQFAVAEDTPSVAELSAFFEKELGLVEARVQFDAANNMFFARFGEITEQDHQRFIALITEDQPSFEELSFQSIGPSVSGELRRKAITAIVLVLIAISLYVAYAFRKVYRPVSSWKYGVIALVTLFHDVIIPTGLLAILGRQGIIEVDTNFVVALLVVMGFSVHDTIVVFDRIRENLSLEWGKGKSDFEPIVNTSVNQTIARSVNTSVTLVFVLLALYFLGPVTLQFFVLTLLVGTVMGTYSSIFVASPLLTIWHRARR